MARPAERERGLSLLLTSAPLPGPPTSAPLPGPPTSAPLPGPMFLLLSSAPLSGPLFTASVT